MSGRSWSASGWTVLARRVEACASASPVVLLGCPEEIADQLVEHRARWGISYRVVFEDAVDEFAPVVQRLGGR